MTRTEWRLLLLLMLARGAWLSRGQCMDFLFSDRLDPPLEHNINVHIYWLRRAFRGTRLRIDGWRGKEICWRAVLT